MPKKGEPMPLAQRKGLARNRIERALAAGKQPSQKDLATMELQALPEQETTQPPPSQASSQQLPNPPRPPVGVKANGAVHSDASDKSKEKRVAGSEKEYKDFFENRFGPLVVLVLFLVMSDMEKAAFYAPSPDECAEAAPHLAHLLAKYKLPAGVQRIITTSDDSLALLMVVAGYLDRIGVLKKFLPVILASTVNRGKNVTTNNSRPVQTDRDASASASNGHDASGLYGLTSLIGAGYTTD